MKILLFSTIILFFASLLFGQGNEVCPIIKVVTPENIPSTNDSAKFSVSIAGNIENLNLEYKWKTSAGDILEGQSTSSVSIRIYEDMRGKTATATVEIKGLPENCPNSFSGSVEIEPRPIIDRHIDEYGKITWKDEKMRLESGLLVELANEPKFIAFFLVTYQKNSELKLIKSRQKKIARFLQNNKISPNRFKFVDGGKSGHYSTSIWLQPEGALPENIKSSLF